MVQRAKDLSTNHEGPDNANDDIPDDELTSAAVLD